MRRRSGSQPWSAPPGQGNHQRSSSSGGLLSKRGHGQDPIDKKVRALYPPTSFEVPLYQAAYLEEVDRQERQEKKGKLDLEVKAFQQQFQQAQDQDQDQVHQVHQNHQQALQPQDHQEPHLSKLPLLQQAFQPQDHLELPLSKLPLLQQQAAAPMASSASASTSTSSIATSITSSTSSIPASPSTSAPMIPSSRPMATSSILPSQQGNAALNMNNNVNSNTHTSGTSNHTSGNNNNNTSAPTNNSTTSSTAAASVSATAANGGPLSNGLGVTMPANAGQQMDLNLVYAKLIELSDVLKDNREKTAGVLSAAEELATRAAATGAIPSISEANNELNASRIAALTKENHILKQYKSALLYEQRENMKLIGEYETTLGTIVAQVRHLAYTKDAERHADARRHGARLQAERDAHLTTRLERDEWCARAMRASEMIRTAYRLRCEEEDVPITIIVALQAEVRGLRSAMGLEKERFEDEAGYEFLKDVPGGAE